MLYKKRKYNPKMYGLRDCVIDTDYHQLKDINRNLILKAKKIKYLERILLMNYV